MLAEFAVFNGYVTILEVFWTLMGIVGMFYGVRNLRQDYADLYALDMLARNGYLRRIALMSLHTEWLRIGVFGMEIAMGIAAMATPPANADQPLTPLQFIVTGGLIGINVLVTGMSYLVHRTRKELD